MQKKVAIFSMGLLLLISNITALGGTVYVDKNGEQDYTSIQAAIDAASAGDTVNVSSGVYFEKIIIDKTINLVGSGKGISIIDGSGNGHVVDVNANNVTIQGFTIKNGTYGINMRNSSNSTIAENTIRTTDYGIYMNNSANNTIYNNNFIENTQNAYDEDNNNWDNGYSKGGNYWDDYIGIDSDEDGIGDIYFNIPGGDNQDKYPLMNPINEAPDVDFRYSPSNPTTQDTLYLNDISVDVDGDIVDWIWAFGDGDTSNISNTIHQYSDNGVYTVTLKVTDDLGVSSQVSKSIIILNVRPIADFTYTPDTPDDVQITTFNDSSVDVDGDIVIWYWDFGDRNTSNLTNPKHQFRDDGSYIVTLNVTDDDGAETSISKEILVLNVKPNADFTYTPNNPEINDMINFIDNSKDYDGIIISWSWDFGDGTTSTEKSPSHQYSTIGDYEVTLTVVDDDGESDTETVSVKIFDFSSEDEEYEGFIVLLIVFIVLFSAMIVSIMWFIKKNKPR